MHSKLFNPDYDNGQFLYGMSPIYAGQKPNKTIIEGYNATVRGLINNGAYGALTNDSELIMTPEELEALENAYNNKFTGGGDSAMKKSKMMFSAMKLRWINFGISPVDLNIIESNKWALQDICRVFNVPSVLFNDNATATYDNMRTAKKMVWQDNILPALIDLEDELNRWLAANYNNKYGTKLYVAPYLNNISELKDDFNQLVSALNLAKDMTPNERRDMLDLDRIEEPGMNTPDVLKNNTVIQQTNKLYKDDSKINLVQ
jgi:HK97 family phage portal protein